jgi:hypothetical protein
LAFRRRVGALDERMPEGSESLRRAAWASLVQLAAAALAELRGWRREAAVKTLLGLL